MSERRYDDDEVAVILHRAAEVAATDRDRGADGGLTLAELKEIGAEAGIDASRIEEAAKEMAVRRGEPPPPLPVGFSPTEQLERLVPGRLDPKTLPQLLDLIRTEFARHGIVEEVLGGMEWRASSVMGGRYVSIRRDGDATRVRVLGNYRDGLLVFGFGPGPMLAIGGGLLAAGLGAAPLVVGIASALGWASAYLPWRYFFGRERRSLRRVLDAIERRIRELA